MTVETAETVLDVVASVCLLGGSLLTFAAAVGLVRFPDLLARTHVAAKPQVLGLLLMLIGLSLRLRTPQVLWVLVLVAAFQMLTSPVAAHMVSRAGFRTGKVRHDLLVVDELSRDMEAAEREARPHGEARPQGEPRPHREPRPHGEPHQQGRVDGVAAEDVEGPRH
jgi:multicomponent Na+:H+ antiporter subunit G